VPHVLELAQPANRFDAIPGRCPVLQALQKVWELAKPVNGFTLFPGCARSNKNRAELYHAALRSAPGVVERTGKPLEGFAWIVLQADKLPCGQALVCEPRRRRRLGKPTG